MSDSKLPPRDWILLPVLGLFTMLVLSGATEVATAPFLVARGSEHSCTYVSPVDGGRAMPNCVTWSKASEAQRVTYLFNDCGHRTSLSCKFKKPGTYRVVLIGSSMVLGSHVPADEDFTSRLALDLPAAAGRGVEFYNGSLWGVTPQKLANRLNEILAAQPDLILWAITPWDVQGAEPWDVPAKPTPAFAGLMGRTRYLLAQDLAARSGAQFAADLIVPLRTHLAATHAGLFLEHVLYQSQTLYVRRYLAGTGDSEFLKTKFDSDRQNQLQEFAIYAARIIQQAHAAGVPFAAVMIPNRAQAAMISVGTWPQGYDPFHLDSELRAIITAQGGSYLEILPGYRNVPNPERGYYPVDGHPNAEGHATIARLLAKALADGPFPKLQATGVQEASAGKGR